MNDFVIQMYNINTLPFESFYRLNQADIYATFFNHNRDEFMSPVFLNDERKAFIHEFTKPAASLKNKQSVQFFWSKFEQKFGEKPDEYDVSKYMDELINVEHFNKFYKRFFR